MRGEEKFFHPLHDGENQKNRLVYEKYTNIPISRGSIVEVGKAFGVL